jgi:hypothetical protein
LLKHALAIIDEAGLGAYLEATQLAVPLYLQFGSQEKEQLELTHKSKKFSHVAMVREQRDKALQLTDDGVSRGESALRFLRPQQEFLVLYSLTSYLYASIT